MGEQFEILMQFLWTLSFSIQLVFFLLALMIYLRSRQAAFLTYSLYIFLLLIYARFKMPFENVPYLNSYSYTPLAGRYVQILAFVAYFYFLMYFMDIQERQPSLFRHFHRLLMGLVGLGTGFILYYWSVGDPRGFDFYFFYVSCPLAAVMILYFFWRSRHMDGALRKFFIWGNILYYTSVALCTLMSIFPVDSDFFFARVPVAIFFAGLIFELMVFSWGLGYKIEGEYRARLATQDKLRRLEKAQTTLLEERLKIKEDELNSVFIEQQKERELSLKNQYEDQLTRMEIDLFRAQMNPHLLFNSLNTLKHFILREDKVKGVGYLSKLSTYMRRILGMTSVRLISLKQEFDFLRIYVDMENMRFDQDIVFKYESSIDKPLEEIQIPPMILQPIVENAFHHGLVQKEGMKTIEIEIQEQPPHLHLIVRDNGIGRAHSRLQNSGSKGHKSRGMDLVRERIILAYNRKPMAEKLLSIKDLYEGGRAAGTEVHLTLPLI